jgi:hypothetical protein
VTTVTDSTTPLRPGTGGRAPDFTLRHTFTGQVTPAGLDEAVSAVKLA